MVYNESVPPSLRYKFIQESGKKWPNQRVHSRVIEQLDCIKVCIMQRVLLRSAAALRQQTFFGNTIIKKTDIFIILNCLSCN